MAYSRLKRLVNRLRKYSNVELVPATPSQGDVDQMVTRSSDNSSYYRVVSSCRVCDTGHVEMLQSDFDRVKKSLPLNCDHGERVDDLVVEDKPETGLYKISLQALTGARKKISREPAHGT